MALSGGLAACGGGGGSTDTSMMPTPQEMCEDAGGRYNADGSCTSATELQVEMLQAEIAALRTQLGLAPSDDIGDSITELQNQLAALRKQAQDAQDAEDKAAMEAAVATAAKLFAGIYAPAADATGTAVGEVHAAYNADDTAIVVTIGDGTAANATTLSENKKAMVDDNHGWAGKMYADPAGGPSYEAVVYSNVEAPTMGRKFGAETVTETDTTRAYQYDLTNGELTFSQLTAAGAPARVAITGVTRTAGTETFSLPDPNTNNEQLINRGGSFHGVSGTYTCDTGASRTDACTADVAAEGLTLVGAWTFTPNSAEARVTDAADTAYASYGWWIHKTAFETAFTASTFHDFKGTAGAVDIANLVAGTATYVGGAAGKYALSSATGGTNDAGHFTAKATLEAEFGDATAGNTITGTIDTFMGADGMSRDWSVELNETAVTDAGVITLLETTATDAATVWTIGEDAAAGSGEWGGNLREEGDDGVPTVATGTFYTEFGREGKMVGAFGANLE